MDSTNCSAGYASDHFLLYGSDFQPNSCNVSYAIVIGVYSTFLIVRSSVNVLQFHLWLRRERSGNPKKLHNSKQQRLPVVPLITLSQTIFMGLFFILGVTNVANAGNGVTLFLFQMYFIPLSIIGHLFGLRIITLGKRLLPLAAPGHTGKTSIMQQKLDHKSTAIQCMLILVNFSNLTVFCASIVGMFVPSFVILQVLCSCYIAVDYIVIATIGYQYERVIRAIRACQDSSNNINSRGNVENVSKAVRRLRVQQIAFSVLFPLSSIIWILIVTRTVPAYYWLLFIVYAAEIICTAFSVVAFAGGCSRRNGKSSPSGEVESAVESAKTNLKVISAGGNVGET